MNDFINNKLRATIIKVAGDIRSLKSTKQSNLIIGQNLSLSNTRTLSATDTKYSKGVSTYFDDSLNSGVYVWSPSALRQGINKYVSMNFLHVVGNINIFTRKITYNTPTINSANFSTNLGVLKLQSESGVFEISVTTSLISTTTKVVTSPYLKLLLNGVLVRDNVMNAINNSRGDYISPLKLRIGALILNKGDELLIQSNGLDVTVDIKRIRFL